MPAKNDFERSMERLERIVADLESGQFSLEESLAKFEEGMELGNKCRGILERADARVKLLIENAQGELEEKDAEEEH